MIKFRKNRSKQILVLSEVLRIKCDAPRLEVSQYSDGGLGVSRLNESGKVEAYTAIAVDGETRTEVA
jgi:hypothetical protein